MGQTQGSRQDVSPPERQAVTHIQILVEGAHPRDPDSRMGRTRGHKSTKILGCAAEPGALVTVEIVAARKFSLVGKVQGDG